MRCRWLRGENSTIAEQNANLGSKSNGGGSVMTKPDPTSVRAFKLFFSELADAHERPT